MGLGLRHRSKAFALAALGASAIWPIADLYLANRSLAFSSALLAWFAALAIVGILGALAVGRIIGSFERGAAVCAMLLIAFFAFGSMEPALHAGLRAVGLPRGAVSVFAIAWILLGVGIARASRYSEMRNLFLALPIIMMTTSAAVAAASGGHDVKKAGEGQAEPGRWAFRTKPNVYHLLFDGLGRPDVLQQRYGLDFSADLERLQNLGLILAPNVEATELETVPSISGLLDPGKDSRGATDLDPSASLVVRVFRHNGYQFAKYGEVFDFAACKGDEDLCLNRGRSALSETDIAMLRRTPIYPIWKKRILSSTDSRRLPTNLMAVVQARMGAPAFRFSYMVPPHPPFLFDGKCASAPGSADNYTTWNRRGISRYASGYQCVMKSVAAAIRHVVATDPGAIVIVSGDHGTMFARRGRLWSKDALSERHPVFLAVRAPDRCVASLRALRRLPDLYPRLFDCLARVS